MDDRSDVSMRFERFRKKAGLTQKQVADRLGMTPQNISKWETTYWDPTIEQVGEVASALGVAREDILGWYPRGSYPIVGRVAAGQPSEALEFDADERMRAPDDVAATAHASSFFLRVSGDSMDRLFPEGMVLLVDPAAEWHDRDIVVVNVNGYDATVKRIYLAGDTVVLHPESTNPEHVDIVIGATEQFRVVGRVLWAGYPKGWRF